MADFEGFFKKKVAAYQPTITVNDAIQDNENVSGKTVMNQLKKDTRIENQNLAIC